jgi:hypothetical protein
LSHSPLPSPNRQFRLPGPLERTRVATLLLNGIAMVLRVSGKNIDIGEALRS